jgi:hypothetical protein
LYTTHTQQGKKDSLYNSGMRPLVCVMDELEKSRAAAEKASTGGDGSSASPFLKAPPCMSSKGWVRGGEDVCYYPTPYRSVPPSKTARYANATQTSLASSSLE